MFFSLPEICSYLALFSWRFLWCKFFFFGLFLILLDFTQACYVYFKKKGTFVLVFLGFVNQGVKKILFLLGAAVLFVLKLWQEFLALSSAIVSVVLPHSPLDETSQSAHSQGPGSCTPKATPAQLWPEPLPGRWPQ